MDILTNTAIAYTILIAAPFIVPVVASLTAKLSK